jgi:hypothetical protein
MRRQAAAALLGLMVATGCSSSEPSGGLPADPAPPPGLMLRIEPVQARAGDLVTMSIQGRAAATSVMSVAADFQAWDGRGWTTLYLLEAWGTDANEPVAVPAGQRHFVRDIAMVATQVLRLKVPPVGPGEYRIVKEATRDRPGRPRVVLYGRLRVVG